jgi:hypothetical protein
MAHLGKIRKKARRGLVDVYGRMVIREEGAYHGIVVTIITFIGKVDHRFRRPLLRLPILCTCQDFLDRKKITTYIVVCRPQCLSLALP